MGTFTTGDVVAQKYRVERALGVGGMGYVVAARHLQLGHLVALKFVRAGMIEGEEAHKRFFREAKAAARLRGDHVCRVLDVAVTEDKTPYMVMEYLEGADLSAMMKDNGPFEAAEACGYVLQACEGLAEAHAANIIHRDIKPANLFVTRGPGNVPLVKILDFGISKSDPLKEETEGVTATKAMLGSPRFMSPEQIRDPRTVDPRSDIWSLGVVLYRLVTGQWPFEAENLGALIARVATAKPVDPRKHIPELPGELVAIMMRCLEKTREARFGSVGELAHALAQLTDNPELSRMAVERVYDLLSAGPNSGEIPRLPTDESTGWGATGAPLGRPSSLGAMLGAAALVTSMVLGGALYMARMRTEAKSATSPELAGETTSQSTGYPEVTARVSPQTQGASDPRTTIYATPAVSQLQGAQPPLQMQGVPQQQQQQAIAQSAPLNATTAVPDARSPAMGAQPVAPIVQPAPPEETVKAKSVPRKTYYTRPTSQGARGGGVKTQPREDSSNGLPTSRD